MCGGGTPSIASGRRWSTERRHHRRYWFAHVTGPASSLSTATTWSGPLVVVGAVSFSLGHPEHEFHRTWITLDNGTLKTPMRQSGMERSAPRPEHCSRSWWWYVAVQIPPVAHYCEPLRPITFRCRRLNKEGAGIIAVRVPATYSGRPMSSRGRCGSGRLTTSSPLPRH